MRLVLGDRLLERTLLKKRVAKTGVSIRVVRLYLDSCLQIRDCFLDAAVCKKHCLGCNMHLRNLVAALCLLVVN